MIEPIFNNLSMPAAGQYEARELLQQLVRVFSAADESLIKSKMMVSMDFYQLELAENYSVIDWLGDGMVSRDLKDFFLEMVTGSPFIENKLKELDEDASSEELCCKEECSGSFLLAYYLKGLLFSFNLKPWDVFQLQCMQIRIEDSGEISETQVLIRNISKLDHYLAHENFFNECRKFNTTSKEDLWDNRDSLFKYIEFCPSFKNDLDETDQNGPHFHQLVDKLFYLNGKFENWKEGDIDLRGQRCSPVSEETQKKYESYYTFLRQGGTKILATKKLYITPGKNRLYFYIDYKVRRCVICHFGEKLPDITYGIS